MKPDKKSVKTMSIILLAAVMLSCQAAKQRAAAAVNTAVTARDTSRLFSSEDFDANYNTATAVKINISSLSGRSLSGVEVNGKTVSINAEGVYILSGNLNDGRIIVDAGNSAKVHIIFDNVSVTNSSSAPIYVKNAGKVYITSAKGSKNTLAVNGAFTQTDGNKADGVIFANSDLTLNGSGELTVTTQYGSGIVSKKDLRITGGIFAVTASHHALAGTNNVSIDGGTFVLTSGKDGIHSENGADAQSGNIYIKAGTFTISAEGEAFDAINDITIDGGTIDIAKADEGMQAAAISINGGKIVLVSTDDGLNASYSGKEEILSNMKLSTAGLVEKTYINITGGEIRIDSQADGIDSNGSVYVSGGKIDIAGPTANDNTALDYDVQALISGGEFIASGSCGMVQGFSNASTQASFAVCFSKAVKGEITVTDKSGKVIVKAHRDKAFQSLIIGSKDLRVGETYTVTAGGETVSAEMTSIAAGTGMNGGMDKRMRSGKMNEQRFRSTNMPMQQSENAPERPQGQKRREKTDTQQRQLPPADSTRPQRKFDR